MKHVRIHHLSSMVLPLDGLTEAGLLETRGSALEEVELSWQWERQHEVTNRTLQLYYLGLSEPQDEIPE